MSMNDPSINMPRVLQDNPAIGRIGAEHLASLGIRNMGFLTHTLNHFHQERYEGFRDACQDLGLHCTLIEVPGDFATKNDSAEWLTRHINQDDRPFGIMTAADYLSQWVIRGCASANLSIPDDVAIVGVDNCREICELAPIALSSIDNNAFRQGYEAARLLDRILNDQPPPDDPIRIPAGSLYVRESSSILATRHPHVATALKYIAEHYTDPDLSTKQITDLVPMSDRRLHDAFLAHVGRSVYQEITHRRIQHAIQLIQETDLKLWDISESVGFNSPEAMSRLFRRQLGHPPSAYRTPGSHT
jgi:LacI family transcriptional regulator